MAKARRGAAASAVRSAICSAADISQITPKFREIVPPLHRQENCAPSAAIRWPEFGDRTSVGSPFPRFREEGSPLLISGRRAGSHIVNIGKPRRRVRKVAGVENVPRRHSQRLSIKRASLRHAQNSQSSLGNRGCRRPITGPCCSAFWLRSLCENAGPAFASANEASVLAKRKEIVRTLE